MTDGRSDGRTLDQTDGQTADVSVGRTDGRTGGRTGGRTDVCDRRELDERFGEALDEDFQIGVVLAPAPPPAQIHCHLNSHILEGFAHARTMLFDSCRAQAEVAASENVPMDLSMSGKATRKARAKAKSTPQRLRSKERHQQGCQ